MGWEKEGAVENYSSRNLEVDCRHKGKNFSRKE